MSDEQPPGGDAGGGDAGGSGRAIRVIVAFVFGFLMLFFLLMLPLVLVGSVFDTTEKVCEQAAGPSLPPHFPSGSGSWTATAYGPPWGGIQGTGTTAIGIDLRPAKPAHIVAVDPTVIPLRSYVHVRPNPFGRSNIAFLAGDTGGAIKGKRIDIYDWRGRDFQYGWGRRQVEVTRAATPGAGNVLAHVAPPSAQLSPAAAAGCAMLAAEVGPVRLTPGQRAQILPDGSATAPHSAPPRIKRFIAAANLIHTKPYVYGGGHGLSLDMIVDGYDCSSSTSFALHRAGMLGPIALDSTGLESWGAPGPGRWLTVYANGGHAFAIVAGISWNTAHYGQTSPAGDGPRWSYDITGQLSNDTFHVRHWPGM